jgi:hypothetical protein
LVTNAVICIEEYFAMRRHHLLLLWFISVLLGTLLPSSVPATQAADDTPGPGWVAAGKISGGCNTSGSCDGNTSPPLEGWYEYVPDHVDVEADEGPTGAPNGQGSVSPARQQCWYDTGGSRYTLQWASGSWHHGAYWSRINGRWIGPQAWNWGFLHDDWCRKDIPPTAIPTATTVPTATAVPPPGSLTVAVLRCGTSGMATTITAYAGAWSQSQYTSSVTFSVPPALRQVSYVVDVPSGWTASGGAASGTVAVGSAVTVTLTSSACAQPTPAPGQTPLPTPTEPPAPCTGTGPYSGFRIPLAVSGAGAAVTPTLYAEHAGGRDSAPSPDPVLGMVTPGIPVTIRFDFSGLTSHFAPDHSGQAQIRFGLLDRTTGQTLIATTTTDVKELKGSTGQVILWGRTLQLTQVALGRGVMFGGAQVWRQWAGHRTGGGWINPQSQPQLNRYYGPLQPVTATFLPEAGHVYEAWSVAAQGACRLDYWRWSRALFGAGPELTPTAPPTCPGGICVPPTPLPTPTPPPPPPVPPASLTTRLALHSRYDPVSSWNGTTEGAASATDAVNISQNLQVVWPMGEPLDWTPRVTPTPIPEQVMNDPW